MAEWILVINDTMETFHERVQAKTWPIYKNTSNRNNIEIDDRVVFYKAGKNGKRFIGSAKIGSQLQNHKDDFKITLKDIDLWKKHIVITDVLMELDFIKNKTAWSNYLVGGIRKLSTKSFEYLNNNH